MSYLYLFFNKKKIDKSIPYERLGFNSLFAAMWEVGVSLGPNGA